jgi:hypothetical protein
MIHAYGDDFSLHSSGSFSADDLYNEVAASLLKGDGPLITLREDLGLTHHPGHVLVAYDLQKGTQGDFYIDVYDPNVPFLDVSDPNAPLLSSENDPTAVLPDGTTLHTLRENDSRVHVFADRHWEFPLLGVDGQSPEQPWASGMDGLEVIPYSKLPTHLNGPWSLTGFLTTFFGDAGATQITDAAGHTLLGADGSLNRDPATRLPGAAPYSPFDGDGSGAPSYVLDGNGPYTETLHSAGTGNYTAALLGNNMVIQLATTGSPGADDQLTVDARAGTVRFHTAAASKAITLQLSAQAADGSERTYSITTTSFGQGDDIFTFDPVSQSLTCKHTGPAADLTINESGVDSHGTAINLTPPTLHVGGGDAVVVHNSDVSQIPGSPPAIGPVVSIPPAALSPAPPATPQVPNVGVGRGRHHKHRPAPHGHKHHKIARMSPDSVVRE